MEPELSYPAPRRVALASHVQAWRVFFANAVAGLSLIGYHLAVAPAAHYWRDLAWGCVFAVIGVGVGWLAYETRVNRDVSLLRDGYAKRATITDFDLQTLRDHEYTQVPYRYTNSKGQTRTGYISADSADCTKHDFTVGATFTLLVPPDDPYSPTPYFRITEAAIPGAPPPKIAPP